jgi:hypothetical protein
MRVSLRRFERVTLLSALVLLANCGSKSDDDDSGPSGGTRAVTGGAKSTGGSATGGSATGGSPTGGATSTRGGNGAGGSAAGSGGSRSSGGSATGGASTGGRAQGGAATTGGRSNVGGFTIGGDLGFAGALFAGSGGLSGCHTNSIADFICEDAALPHLYLCITPYTAPDGCVARSAGDATDTYCCP